MQADKADGERALRITYWTFYGLSEPPGADAGTRFLVHEGDWERISVLLKPGANAGEYLPLSVRYHAHDGSRDVPWAAVKRVGTSGSADSTHPVVYSAIGSHASYWRTGRYENVFYLNGRRQFAVFDDARSCSRCPQWRTWDRSSTPVSSPGMDSAAPGVTWGPTPDSPALWARPHTTQKGSVRLRRRA